MRQVSRAARALRLTPLEVRGLHLQDRAAEPMSVVSATRVRAHGNGLPWRPSAVHAMTW
jgi:hypothetical protein